MTLQELHPVNDAQPHLTTKKSLRSCGVALRGWPELVRPYAKTQAVEGDSEKCCSEADCDTS